MDFTIYDKLNRVPAVIRQAELSPKDRKAEKLEHNKQSPTQKLDYFLNWAIFLSTPPRSFQRDGSPGTSPVFVTSSPHPHNIT